MTLYRRPTFWLIVVFAFVLAFVPGLTGDVALRENLLLAAVYIILASNLNIMIGYTDYVNFGNIVFFGLGGYIGVYLIHAQSWPLWAAAPVAGVVVSLLAGLLGTGILRLRGAYFALATVGVNEAVKAFVANFEPFGGGSGMYLSFSAFDPLGGPRQALWIAYYALVGLMAASLVLSLAIKNSRFGLGLFAIREDEDAAQVLGVKTPRYKTLAYATSAFIPAVAGTVFFFKNGVIVPAQAFDLVLSITAIVMLMLGGRGSVFGVALGAFVYEQFRGFLLVSPMLSQFQLVIAGILLLLVVQFFPEGLMGWIYHRVPRLRRILQ